MADTPGDAHPVRPLLLSGDEPLLDEVLRLAAAAGTEIEVAPDPSTARTAWAHATMVLIGRDAAGACARARLPQRRGVVLVVAGAEAAAPGEDDWALAAELGADHVLALPAGEAWLVERLGRDGHPRASGRIVAVIGGRGGAGASVLAAAMAVTAARTGRQPLLIDADPLGGGLDLMLGWEEVSGVRWPELAQTHGRVSVPALYGELPRSGRLVVLSWDRGDLLEAPVEAMDVALDAGRRASDVVIVDLPRHLDTAAVRVLQAADRVLLVVPAEIRSCAAAARVAAAIGPHVASLQVVVRGPAPSRLPARKVAKALGLPLAGTLRPEPGLTAALDRGLAPASRGTGPLAELCGRLLDDLVRPANGEEAAA